MQRLPSVHCLFYLLAAAGFIFATSCSKSESPCFTSYGNEVVETRLVDQFSEVEVRGDLPLKIVPASEQKVEIAFGENLTEYITTTVVDGKLKIKNEVKCAWLRDLSKKPQVTVFIDSLRYLYKEGAGDVEFADTLRSSSFFYEQRNLAGAVHILYHGPEIKLALHTGYTRCTVAGQAKTVELYSNTVGSLDARALKTEYCAVHNSSISDMYVYSSGYLFAAISGEGDVYYKGSPGLIDSDITGTGLLLPF